MRKEWILSEEEKIIKRQKIEQNRRIKKEAQRVLQHQSNHSEIRSTSFDVSFSIRLLINDRIFHLFSKLFRILDNQ